MTYARMVMLVLFVYAFNDDVNNDGAQLNIWLKLICTLIYLYLSHLQATINATIIPTTVGIQITMLKPIKN